MGDTAARVAVVLFNLGGPDRPAAIRPFLRNLFRDPAILRVPGPIRRLLAWLIVRARLRAATENYALLGGSSPLLPQTRDQAAALQASLGIPGVQCFVAMRYWHPLVMETARAVQAWRPDQVILLPLFPQFSTTTTGSAFAAWHEACAAIGLVAETRAICCWCDAPKFIAATSDSLRATLGHARATLPSATPLRVLFSAHGLPEAIVRAGDPYAIQVARTVEAIRAAIGPAMPESVLCYQSRATPQRWLAPATTDEIARAARDRVAVVVVPISFVSEHVETLVELDVEYRELAGRLGVPGYFRVQTVGTDDVFVSGLAAIVAEALARGTGVTRERGGRLCPKECGACPNGAGAETAMPAVGCAAVGKIVGPTGWDAAASPV